MIPREYLLSSFQSLISSGGMEEPPEFQIDLHVFMVIGFKSSFPKHAISIAGQIDDWPAILEYLRPIILLLSTTIFIIQIFHSDKPRAKQPGPSKSSPCSDLNRSVDKMDFDPSFKNKKKSAKYMGRIL